MLSHIQSILTAIDSMEMFNIETVEINDDFKKLKVGLSGVLEPRFTYILDIRQVQPQLYSIQFVNHTSGNKFIVHLRKVFIDEIAYYVRQIDWMLNPDMTDDDVENLSLLRKQLLLA